MPTVRFGFFHCDFCGLQFDTGDEATRHEMQCTHRRQYPFPHGSQPPQQMQGLAYSVPQVSSPHRQQQPQNPQSQQPQPYYLQQPPHQNQQPTQMLPPPPPPPQMPPIPYYGYSPMQQHQQQQQYPSLPPPPPPPPPYQNPRSPGRQQHVPPMYGHARRNPEDENRSNTTFKGPDRRVSDQTTNVSSTAGIQQNTAGTPTREEADSNDRNQQSQFEPGDTTASKSTLETPPKGTPSGRDFDRSTSAEKVSSIAPTPVQTRRDRTDIADHATTEHRLNQDRPPDARPDLGGKDDATESTNVARAQYPSSQDHADYNQMYDLPSTFPFFQDRDRLWKCKFCINLPVFHRSPQSVWTSGDGSPPPGSYIDQHLSVCSSYQQGYMSHHHGRGGYISSYHSYGQHGNHQQQQHFPYGVPSSGAATSDSNVHFPTSQMMHNPSASSVSVSRGMSIDHGSIIATAEQRTIPHGATSNSDNRATIPRRRSDQGFAVQHDNRRSTTSIVQTNSETIRQSIEYLIRFDNDYWTKETGSNTIPKLVLDEDKLLLTDYFFYLMKQLRLCRFSESDRKTRGGKREKIKIGFGGLQCIHCSDVPMSRKFFWSNVDRLANSFAEIPGHIMKCRRCPQQAKDALMQLKAIHSEQMAKLPRGSQKVFFRRMWRRLHDDDEEFGVVASGSPDHVVRQAPPLAISTGRGNDESPGSIKSSDVSPMSGSNTINSDETILVVQRTAAEAAKVLSMAVPENAPLSPSSKVLLAIPEDKEWLSEKDIYIRKQIEVFCATQEDVIAAQRDRMFPISAGAVGFRCIHCSLAKRKNAGEHAVFYPLSVGGIYESVREFQRLHLDSCKNLPSTTRAKLEGLQGATSLSSVLRKYYHIAARALGLYDSGEGIRSGGKISPIGSHAAFTFPDEDFDTTVPKGGEDTNDDERKIPGKDNEQGVRERKRSGSTVFATDLEASQPKTPRTS